jgi:uncharacterized protein (TIGR02145 family)
MFIKKDSLRGVAALITVISLGSLVFVISLSTAILSFWSIKNIDSNQKSTTAYYAAYSGIQDALIKLERNKDFFSEYCLSVNDVDDVTVVVSNTGDSATIISSAVVGQILKRIQATVSIDSTTGLITPIETQEVVISTTTTTTTATTTTTEPPQWACGDSFIDDRNSKEYSTLAIGTQCWMGENLDYDDGCSSETWVNATDVGWCGYYADGPYTNEGLLYQWSAAMVGSTQEGAQGICPDGWHVPTNAEWETLISYVGDEEEASKLAGGYDLWNDGDLRQSSYFGNSGLDVLPAGLRDGDDGTYQYRGGQTGLWTSTEREWAGCCQSWTQFWRSTLAGLTNLNFDWWFANGLRCIKN